MHNKTNILSINFDNVTIEEAYKKLMDSLNSPNTKKPFVVYTPNAEIVLNAKKDKVFKDIINAGDLVLPDGMGVIKSARILNKELKSKVSGVDFMFKILKESEISCFLLGAKPEITEKCKMEISKSYKNIHLVGIEHGYFEKSKEADIVKRINSLKPDALFVAFGSPKQELFISQYKNDLKDVGFAIGVGGSFDILSGTSSLAPEFIRKSGFEWLYRTIKEPKRIKRIAKLPLILVYSFIERIKNTNRVRGK